MNSVNLKVCIPAGVTLVASHIMKYNAPELIASEGFRYFSLFILLSVLSSLLLVALSEKRWQYSTFTPCQQCFIP